MPLQVKAWLIPSTVTQHPCRGHAQGALQRLCVMSNP